MTRLAAIAALYAVAHALAPYAAVVTSAAPVAASLAVAAVLALVGRGCRLCAPVCRTRPAGQAGSVHRTGGGTPWRSW